MNEQEIKTALSSSRVIHVDETGLYEMSKRIWLHSTSTPSCTYYHADKKRGKEAMDNAGILPGFKGVAVHDHWPSYKHYETCDHACCNVHHIRELQRADEQDHKPWAKDLKELLHKIKDTVDTAREKGKGHLPVGQVDLFQKKYRTLIDAAKKEYPTPPPREKGKRGRVKQGKSKNLLDRLDRCERDTVRFMYDFNVPFDNNLAERDLRMIKVKQKISGTFRSQEGSAFFCRIRGSISTWKKQGENILEVLTQSFMTNPIQPRISCTSE